jgi:hypothetical protein
MNFGTPLNIVFTIRVKILVLIKWSHTSPQLSGLLRLEWLSYFEHVVQSLLNTSFWYPFLEPHLTTYPLIIGVLIRKSNQIRVVYLNGLNWICNLDFNYYCLHSVTGYCYYYVYACRWIPFAGMVFLGLHLYVSFVNKFWVSYQVIVKVMEFMPPRRYGGEHCCLETFFWKQWARQLNSTVSQPWNLVRVQVNHSIFWPLRIWQSNPITWLRSTYLFVLF